MADVYLYDWERDTFVTGVTIMEERGIGQFGRAEDF
jgi:hypothetical protein